MKVTFSLQNVGHFIILFSVNTVLVYNLNSRANLYVISSYLFLLLNFSLGFGFLVKT